MTSQGEDQEEQTPIPLQVFEFQIDPDRNAIIRRALAKRIVRQRELDEEEASTEEDESFLAGDSIATRRSIASTPGKVSPRKRTPEGQQQGKMNAKSRWKTEYLRTRSSSPSGSSIFATEAVVAEGNTSIPGSSDIKPNGNTLIAHEEPKKDVAVDRSESETPDVMDMDKDEAEGHEPSALETAPSEETKEIDGVGTAREPSPDLAEEELLAKLESLKKEKSRLFALFRSTLQRKEEGPSTAPTSVSSTQQPPQSQPSLPPPPPPPPPIPPQMPAEMRARETAKRASDSKEASKTNDHDKRSDTSRSVTKRREGERVIDRSKLNLEIPRKPSVSSSTTNSASSTSSTPTFGPSSSGPSFPYPQKMKPKRPRSISPTHSHPPQPTSSSNNNMSSIAGRGTSNYSEPSSSKYPRADYGPPSSTPSSHSRNSSNGSTFGSHITNMLPEKPQVRYPGGNRSHHNGSVNDDHFHRSSSKASGTGAGSGSSGSLLPSSSISSLSGHGVNGGSNTSYRQQHSSSYHPQGPSRGGFGMRGRGGYFGHGEGGFGSGSNSGSGPIPLLGPSGRPLPFNRNMMQMPHTRGPFHSRLGFGRGGVRHPSSPRGEWPRRRSRD